VWSRLSEDVAVCVKIEARGGGERWTRDFAGQKFASTLDASDVPGRIRERFGPITCELGLAAGEHGLSMDVVAWSVGSMPLPSFPGTYGPRKGMGRPTGQVQI
jgi:hypothetical protein